MRIKASSWVRLGMKLLSYWEKQTLKIRLIVSQSLLRKTKGFML